MSPDVPLSELFDDRPQDEPSLSEWVRAQHASRLAELARAARRSLQPMFASVRRDA